MYVGRQRARLLPVPGSTGLKDFTPYPPRSGDFFAYLSSSGQDSSYNMLLLLSTTARVLPLGSLYVHLMKHKTDECHKVLHNSHQAKHFEYLQSATIGCLASQMTDDVASKSTRGDWFSWLDFYHFRMYTVYPYIEYINTYTYSHIFAIPLYLCWEDYTHELLSSTACSLKTLRLMPRRCLPKEGEAHAACRQLRRCDIVKIFHSRHACYCMSSVLFPEFSSSNNFLWKKSRLVQCMEEGDVSSIRFSRKSKMSWTYLWSIPKVPPTPQQKGILS